MTVLPLTSIFPLWDCPKLLPDGKRFAAEAFLEKDVLSDEPELWYSPKTGQDSKV
jgi:hypothetical protein